MTEELIALVGSKSLAYAILGIGGSIALWAIPWVLKNMALDAYLTLRSGEESWKKLGWECAIFGSVFLLFLLLCWCMTGVM